MTSHVPLMKAIQSHEKELHDALGPDDSVTFEKRYKELFQMVRDHPDQSDEVYDQLKNLINSYPAASRVLQQEIPTLLDDPEAIPTKPSNNFSGQLQPKSNDSKSENVEAPIDTTIKSTQTGNTISKSSSLTSAEASFDRPEAKQANTIDTRQHRRSRSGEQQWAPEQVIQLVKEVVTALMGLLIVGYTLYLTNAVLGFAGDARKLPDAKDLLLLLLSLAGVVIGYYFGRIPADARATQAQRQANEATVKAVRIGTKAGEIARTLDAVVNQTAFTRGAGYEAIDTTTIEKLRNLQDELRELSDLSGFS
jgi:hypothetical protein